MSQKKILIIDDEWSIIQASFDMANIYKFNGELVFDVKSKSQDVNFIQWNDMYHYVFVDMKLAASTLLDGFSIVKKILDERLIDEDRVIILTGNNRINERLIEKHINPKSIKILYKPIDFMELSDLLSKKIQCSII